MDTSDPLAHRRTTGEAVSPNSRSERRSPPRQYAELVDRVQLAANLPQLFGTLAAVDGPYYWVDDDEDTINVRRREVELPTVEEDLQAMKARIGLFPVRDQF